MKTCKCGEQFPAYKNKRYCSRECATKSRKLWRRNNAQRPEVRAKQKAWFVAHLAKPGNWERRTLYNQQYMETYTRPPMSWETYLARRKRAPTPT